jgi:hypothetical protein
MSPFRCPSGHRVQLAFGDDQLRLPCPSCGADVYKFRDAVMQDDAPVPADAGERPVPDAARGSLRKRKAPVVIGSVPLIVVAVLFTWHRAVPQRAAAGQDTVIPIETGSAAATATPSSVSITNFSATPTDAGVVKVSFRLTNAGGARNDYPGLIVHWHGVPDADQRIARDSYAHPPLPFTSTDVRLELVRPQGSTGIDVSIAY